VPYDNSPSRSFLQATPIQAFRNRDGWTERQRSETRRLPPTRDKQRVVRAASSAVVFPGTGFDVLVRVETLPMLREVPLNGLIGVLAVAVAELKGDNPGALTSPFGVALSRRDIETYPSPIALACPHVAQRTSCSKPESSPPLKIRFGRAWP
jgi:hypothetical protein